MGMSFVQALKLVPKFWAGPAHKAVHMSISVKFTDNTSHTFI